MSVACPARMPNWPIWPIASAGSRPCSERGSCGASATARNGVAACVLARVQVAIQPAVRRALHAGRGGLHVVLRVEVRARAVGRAAGVDDRELPRVPERLERREPRMQPEEAVEIDAPLRFVPGRAIAMLGRAL